MSPRALLLREPTQDVRESLSPQTQLRHRHGDRLARTHPTLPFPLTQCCMLINNAADDRRGWGEGERCDGSLCLGVVHGNEETESGRGLVGGDSAAILCRPRGEGERGRRHHE